MIKCDQEQSMKRIAELLQERRRPRRTIVEYNPKGSHQSSGVVENAHYHLEGLLRTMRSELREKTGVNVNVKSLPAPWLVRHCVWCLTKFAIGADGQTTFKRQRGKDYTGETACHGEAICCRIRFESKPKWNRDGKRKLDLSDEVIIGTTKGIETTRSFRQSQQINNGIQRLCACLSGYRGNRVASSLTQLEEFANVTSRELWCKHVARQTVAQPAKVMYKFMCQGCRKRFEDFSIERNSHVNHVKWCNKKSLVVWLKIPYQVISMRIRNKNGNNNMRQSWNPFEYHHSNPVRATKIRCK